ncbi:P2Y purinoceptor 3-like [Erpetoichthys calabaricus]|uniref:P2Y purinoceptor 3-like n=1 Tax=Erpetoichthys calabaricus TaxID=27687 RepID=UPI0022347EB2|nr:P2Y purinoceptor 3-like [Erpetoichthys calabaricus]
MDDPEVTISEPVSVNSSTEAYCNFHESYKYILLPVTYGMATVAGLLLNGALLWQCLRSRPWSCSTVYLVNLAVADLLYLPSLPLLTVSYAMRGRWIFGNVACKAARFLFYANMYGSILFLTCISVHRFLGVCYPIRSLPYRTKERAVWGSALSWGVVLIELFPTLVFSRSAVVDNFTICYDVTSPSLLFVYFPYGITLIITGFFIPFLIIFSCYWSMVKVLSRSQERITVGKEIRSKSIRTILVVCTVFALCFVPFHVTRFAYLFIGAYKGKDCGSLNFVMLSYKIWRPIVSFNSCISPVLYFLVARKNRKHMLKLGKNKVNPSP